MAEYDEVIIDLSSGFSEIEEVALKEADVIYVPQVEGEAAVAKMRRFLRETEFQETWRVLAEKMKMIVNRTAASEIRSEFSNSGIWHRFPVFVSWQRRHCFQICGRLYGREIC